MRRLVLAAAVFLVAVVACTPAGPDRFLLLTLTPPIIGVDGAVSTLGILAVDDAGTPLKGTVEVSTGNLGSLLGKTPVDLDPQGRGSLTISCDEAVDPDCGTRTSMHVSATLEDLTAGINLGLLHRGQCLVGWVFEGGDCVDVASTLQLRVELPCGAPTAGGAGCATTSPAPATFTVGGDAGSLYSLSLRVRGVAETNRYALSDGGASRTLWTEGGAPTAGGRNVLSLQVSSPPATYFLNGAATPGSVVVPLNYTQTIQATGGATLTLAAQSPDGEELANRTSAGTPVVVTGVPPAPGAFDGQFVQVDVIAAPSGGNSAVPAPIVLRNLDRVFLLGTLSEGAYDRDVLADPRTPDVVHPAFPQFFRRGVLAAGNLYYTTSFDNGIRIWREDPWQRNDQGQTVFPSPDVVPDPILFPNCSTTPSFWVSPEGHVLHTCPALGSGVFVDAEDGGHPISPAAYGLGGRVLTTGGAVYNLATRTTTVVTGIQSAGGIMSAYPAADGTFLVALWNSTRCGLYRVETDAGLSAQLGTYGGQFCSGVLDGRRTLTQFTPGPGDFITNIEEAAPDGTPPLVIYSEANAPIPSFDSSVFPPKTYVRIYNNSYLVGRN